LEVGETGVFNTVTTGDPPYSFLWDFGDGTGTTGEIDYPREHAYSASGTYIVSATVTDSVGTTAQAQLTVIVTGLPPPPPPPTPSIISISGSTSLEIGETGVFNTVTTGVPPYSFLWDFGDGTGTTGEIDYPREHAYTTPGTYIVSATVTDSVGTTAQAQLTVIVTGVGNQEPYFSPTSTASAPLNREEHSVVWTGSEMIVWGGFGDGSFFDTGGRYDPSTDTWTPTSTTGAAAIRKFHTAVWIGTEMIVWGGRYLDTGGLYDPSTDTWTLTTTTGAPTGRNFHTAVWTGTEMIVWGGDTVPGAGGETNTGARYNPSTDTWTTMTITEAPSPRKDHTAIWTGTEMIVWGGDTGSGVIGTGGRYNPSTDTWTSMTTGTPSARDDHTAVWTGTEMIVWGGDTGSARTNTGGRYNPSTDTWTTMTTGTPSAREDHTAVWTGTEMIAWGGIDSSGRTDTGGRYNPSTDEWVATPLTDAPAGRTVHTAVWTTNEMIVWGGLTGSTTRTNTGGSLLYGSVSSNTPPVADAGADQSVAELTLVTLDGTGSTDADGNPMTYSWSQTAGPPVTLSGATTSNPSFTAPLINSQVDLTFQLIVNDGTDNSTDTVDITVNDVPPPPPTPSIISISGSTSLEVGETGVFNTVTTGVPPYSFLWDFGDGTGTTGEIDYPREHAYTTPGTYIVSATVTDSVGTTAEAQLTVIVTGLPPPPPTPNNPPVSNAGEDQSVDELVLVTLNGTASTDADSDPLTYAWTQTNGYCS